jgi:hypothetical protein
MSLILSIISIAIALLGGIPGILGIIGIVQAKNKLIWINQHLIYGSANDNKKFLMISGLITNKGNKSIYPLHIEMFYRFNRKWIKLNKVLINESVTRFPSDKQNICVKEPSKFDLQKMNYELINSRPQFGHLMFFVPEEIFNYYAQNKKAKLKLFCCDSIKNKHTYNFKIDYSNKNRNKDKIIYPKIGIEVKNKN